MAFCEARKVSRTDQSPTDLVLKRSLDGGRTWSAIQTVLDGKAAAFMDPCPVVKTIYPGSFAYCCLTVLPDMSIGCLFERDNYGKIIFARFTLDWLTDGKDTRQLR